MSFSIGLTPLWRNSATIASRRIPWDYQHLSLRSAKTRWACCGCQPAKDYSDSTPLPARSNTSVTVPMILRVLAMTSSNLRAKTAPEPFGLERASPWMNLIGARERLKGIFLYQDPGWDFGFTKIAQVC